MLIPPPVARPTSDPGFHAPPFFYKLLWVNLFILNFAIAYPLDFICELSKKCYIIVSWIGSQFRFLLSPLTKEHGLTVPKPNCDRVRTEAFVRAGEDGKTETPPISSKLITLYFLIGLRGSTPC